MKRLPRVPAFPLRAALTSSAVLACALGAGTASADTSAYTIERTLYAGQSLPVGTVTITTGTPGSVAFNVTAPNFCVTEIHVAVGELGTDIPLNKQGSPQVGKFPYADYPGPGCVTSPDPIPFDISVGDNVAAHAKVQYADATKAETAWAAGYRFTQTNWSTYVTIAPPLPAKHVFARAYIDRDGSAGYDGSQTSDNPDALIAELADDNNSGYIDVGDKVYTNQYPTTFATDPRADFGKNEHTVTAVQTVFNGASGQIIQVAVAGGTILFGYAANPDGSSIESYSESATGGVGNETLRIADGNGGQQVDTLKALEGDGPSQPEVNVPLATRSGGGDDDFIDIQFDLP